LGDRRKGLDDSYPKLCPTILGYYPTLTDGEAISCNASSYGNRGVQVQQNTFAGF